MFVEKLEEITDKIVFAHEEDTKERKFPLFGKKFVNINFHNF